MSIRKYEIDNLHLISSNFFMNGKLVMKIPQHATMYHTGIDVNNTYQNTADYIVREFGFQPSRFDFESSSPKIIDTTGKDITFDVLRLAIMDESCCYVLTQVII